MKNQPITNEFDWQAQQRQQRRLYLVPQAKETNWQAFKRQATEDKITVTLEIICGCLLVAVLVAQAGIYWNF